MEKDSNIDLYTLALKYINNPEFLIYYGRSECNSINYSESVDGYYRRLMKYRYFDVSKEHQIDEGTGNYGWNDWRWKTQRVVPKKLVSEILINEELPLQRQSRYININFNDEPPIEIKKEIFSVCINSTEGERIEIKYKTFCFRTKLNIIYRYEYENKTEYKIDMGILKGEITPEQFDILWNI